MSKGCGLEGRQRGLQGCQGFCEGKYASPVSITIMRCGIVGSVLLVFLCVRFVRVGD